MTKINIGIDLSTTNVGICLFVNNEFVKVFSFKFDTFSIENIKRAYNIIWRQIDSIFSILDLVDSKMLVGIELSNYRNPQMTGRFNLYAGLFIACLVEKSSYYDTLKIDFKTFNSNGWQMKCGAKCGDDRITRKKLAREFAKNNCDKYNIDWDEDMCDAFGMTYWLDGLVSTEQAHANVKRQKAIKYRNQHKKQIAQQVIATNYRRLNKLDKVRNKKAYENLLNKIHKLEMEKE